MTVTDRELREWRSDAQRMPNLVINQMILRLIDEVEASRRGVARPGWTKHVPLGGQHRQICDALRDCGPMISEEIADLVGFPVWRRMSELERAGKIVRRQATKRTTAGRAAHLWALVKVP